MTVTAVSTVRRSELKRSSGRCAVLLASTAGLALSVLLAEPMAGPELASPAWAVSPDPAETNVRPAGFADIVAKASPAVISVRVKLDGAVGLVEDDEDFNAVPVRPGSPPKHTPHDAPHEERTVLAQGSGFFISADGYAVTNNHVVGKAETVDVTSSDGTIYHAKVIGTDEKTDLALIKVDGGGNLPYVEFADKAPRVGDWALAVGNPFGLGGTVTAGIVSARGRDIGEGPYDDFIQLDAPINRGNSGGPTFDLDGKVMGVNTAIYSPSGGSVGIGFAIPADVVKAVITQLRDKGFVTRGWIGVQIQSVDPELADALGLKKAEGALVDEPQPDGPAAKAGVAAGDLITALDDTPIKDSRDLARKIAAMAPGTSVKLGMQRNGEDKTLMLTLGEVPNEGKAKK